MGRDARTPHPAPAKTATGEFAPDPVNVEGIAEAVELSRATPYNNHL